MLSQKQIKAEAAFILEACADVFEEERAWTKGVLARTISGYSTSEVAPDAACWCSLGAIEVAVKDSFPKPTDFSLRRSISDLAISALKTKTPDGSIVDWNDSANTGLKTVVKAFRAAAQDLRK